MRLRFFRVFFSLCGLSLLSATAWAAPPEMSEAQVRKQELAGVRLSQSLEEARAGMAAWAVQAGAPAPQLARPTYDFAGKVALRLKQPAKWDASFEELYINGDFFTVSATFAQLPEGPRVYFVRYISHPAGGGTAATQSAAQQLLNLALQKFGPPSFDDTQQALSGTGTPILRDSGAMGKRWWGPYPPFKKSMSLSGYTADFRYSGTRPIAHILFLGTSLEMEDRNLLIRSESEVDAAAAAARKAPPKL